MFVHIFALYVGGGGHQRISETHLKMLEFVVFAEKSSSLLFMTKLDNRVSLETGIGGVKSPKIRGGVKILNFRGCRNLTLFYRVSIENPQFGGSKVQALQGQLSGRVS